MQNFLKKLSIIAIALTFTLINTNIALAMTFHPPYDDGFNQSWMGKIGGMYYFGSNYYTLIDETTCDGSWSYIFTNTYGNSSSFLFDTATSTPTVNIKICSSSANQSNSTYGVYYKNIYGQRIYFCFLSDNNTSFNTHYCQAHTTDHSFDNTAEIGITMFGGTPRVSQILVSYQ